MELIVKGLMLNDEAPIDGGEAPIDGGEASIDGNEAPINGGEASIDVGQDMRFSRRVFCSVADLPIGDRIY